MMDNVDSGTVRVRKRNGLNILLAHSQEKFLGSVEVI